MIEFEASRKGLVCSLFRRLEEMGLKKRFIRTAGQNTVFQLYTGC